MTGTLSIINRTIGIVVLSSLAAACGSGGSAASSGDATDVRVARADDSFADTVPYAPTPDADAFYHQPRPFPDLPPGSVLKAREIAFAPLGVPRSNKAWQIQYVTRDANGLRMAAVAAVIQPLVSAVSGKKPVVAYGFAYDSLGAECVPSKMATGNMSTTLPQLEWPTLLPGLDTQGWTLVLADYEGPFHSYGVGRLAGQATLDAVRAALKFEQLGLAADSPVGLWGYSGGGTATAWATSLQPTYAPELNVVAAATGGTPTDVAAIAKAVDENPVTNAIAFGLILSAIQGVNRSYPDFVGSILNERGRALSESQKDGCGGATSDGSPAPSGRLADYTTKADPYSERSVIATINKIKLPQPGLAPKALTYVYHEILDELIPIQGADVMVDAWCQAGSPVIYQRNLSGEHVIGQTTGAPAAFLFLSSVLAGLPAVTLPTATRCN